MKRIITQKDLAANPILKELGIKLGWVVSVTKDEVSLGKSNANEQTTEGDNEGGQGSETPPTGGSQPPPDKGRG